MKMRRNVFWGILFILAAVALVVNKLGFLQRIGFWNILFSFILLGICVRSILRKSWGGILFSTAFFIIVNDKLLHLESLTPWTVLGVALLGTIGLNMLFPIKKSLIWNRKKNNNTGIDWGESDELLITEDGEVIHQDVIFSSSVKYVKSQELAGIAGDCIFGNITVYLTEASLKNHRARISMDVIFGNADIYVPASWKVCTNMDVIFADVSACGTNDASGEDKLLISGDVIFGGMVIHYV